LIAPRVEVSLFWISRYCRPRKDFIIWSGGQVIGATDAFGFRAVEDRVQANDLHATCLKLLGIDHRKLTFLFGGRNERLTGIGGDSEFAARLPG
jgi:hypothetical protein